MGRVESALDSDEQQERRSAAAPQYVSAQSAKGFSPFVTSALEHWTCETLVQSGPLRYIPVKYGEIILLLSQVSQVLGAKCRYYRHERRRTSQILS